VATAAHGLLSGYFLAVEKMMIKTLAFSRILARMLPMATSKLVTTSTLPLRLCSKPAISFACVPLSLLVQELGLTLNDDKLQPHLEINQIRSCKAFCFCKYVGSHHHAARFAKRIFASSNDASYTVMEILNFSIGTAANRIHNRLARLIDDATSRPAKGCFWVCVKGSDFLLDAIAVK
jgi:hypothetical protein